MENTIKIRKLKVSDRKKLSQLILKLSDEVGGTDFTNLISSQVSKTTSEPADDAENDTNSYMQIGLKMLQAVLHTLEEETHEWFADLIGTDKETFLTMPIDTEPEIIKQIVDAPESSSFFTKALHLYNKTKKYMDKQG